VSEPDADLVDIFRDEATGRLDEMDAALLTVESGDAGPETIDALFRHAHTIKGAAAMLGFDDIRALAHAVEDVFAGVRDTGTFPPGLAAPLLRATGALRSQITGTGGPSDGLFEDLAAARTALTGDSGTKPPAGGPAAGAGQQARPPQAAERRTLRVPAEKIDHLLDVVGEVMQDRRRLAHSLGEDAQVAREVSDTLGAGDRMLDELKDTAVGMRTLPLAVIAGPLPRAVRDLARAAGKDVEFVVTGADTELDRVILESLSEPLTHLLRNAVNHGIEPPAERERAGKPARGRIEFRAVARGSLVEIVVADDGRGVPAQVTEMARREGSLADLLTQPGYSTAAHVTDLAGRGVGLDAVKNYVQSLGGSLEIRSEPGRGMEVILVLPLALALLEVLLFERGQAVYGVPLGVVEEVVLVTDTLTLEGRAALEVRGRSLPVADFAALVGATAPRLGRQAPALVISAGGRRAIATCDALLGQQEVVVKPLGPLLATVRGYLGSAILGDGRIALLVEPSLLTRGSRGLSEMPECSPEIPGSAPKVLVVEDSFTVRELQRSILEAAGYPVVTAHDGRDALAVLGHDSDIALVITDLEMPELDGLGLTRAIRADDARSSLPVVIVTSHGSEDDRRKGIEAGADAYMSKRAFDQQTLLATVERLIGR
jgi:two-component system, chemotaxis family, sensor kinase CheA